MAKIVNFLETLIIIAFCSFAIGLYWRFKFRSKYLAMELEETLLIKHCHESLPVSRSNMAQIKTAIKGL